MTYRVKLFITLILLAVLPILVANIISYSYTASELENLIYTETKTIVNKLKYEMKVFHNDAIFNMDGVSKLDDVRNNIVANPTKALRTKVEALLDSMLKINNIFTAYQILNLKGKQIYKVYTDKSTRKKYMNLQKRKYFYKVVSSSKPYISDVIISKATGKPIVIIGHPILNKQKKVIGVLSAIINFYDIVSLIKELNTTPGSYPFITSKNGLILAHIDSELVAKKTLFEAAKLNKEDRNRVLTKKNGFISCLYKNKKFFLYFSNNQTGQYKLFYAIPRADFFHTIDRLRIIIVIVIAIVSILAILVALMISRKIEGAMNEVRLANKQVEEKNNELNSLASKLAKYLSPQLYNSIFTGEKDVKIETSRKNLTIFFSDIKNFSVITDSMQSEALSSVLNEYLDRMSKIAIKYGGTIDKYIGDAIMVFFGDPESKGDKEDAFACVSMAIEMRKTMMELQDVWNAKGISRPLRIRIGINTGYCTIGNFGSEERMDYTIVGGEVNMASRLESNADVDSILISHETYGLIKDRIKCLPKGEITVKGIAHSVKTYEVIDLLDSTGEVSRINVNSDGFKMNLDLSKEIDKKSVLEQLKNAIRQVEEK